MAVNIDNPGASIVGSSTDNPSNFEEFTYSLFNDPETSSSSTYDTEDYEPDAESDGLFYKKKGTSEFKYLNKDKLDLTKYQKLDSMFRYYKILYRASFALTIIGLIFLAITYKYLEKDSLWYYTSNTFIGFFVSVFVLHVIVFFTTNFHQIDGLIETARAVTNLYGANIANNDIHFAAGKLLSNNSKVATSLGNAFLNKYGSGAAGTLVNSLNATGNESFDTVSEPVNYAKNEELDKAKQELYEANLAKTRLDQITQTENTLNEQQKELQIQIKNLTTKNTELGKQLATANDQQKSDINKDIAENSKKIADLQSNIERSQARLQSIQGTKQDLTQKISNISAIESKVKEQKTALEESN